MIKRYYSIHGLVEVAVGSDVRPEVVSEIDFQIGAFYLGECSKPAGSIPQILVRPYSATHEYDVEAGAQDVIFYQSQGSVGRSFRYEAERLFVAKTERGFVVCADYSNFLVNLYIQLLLVPQGITMVHAAAYKASDNGITVLAGAGGIGKTAVLGYAVSERGLQHLGDDIILLDGDGMCRSFPRQFVLKSYHKEIYADVFKDKNLPRWNSHALKRFVLDNAPFTGVLKTFLKRSGFYYNIAKVIRPQPFLATISPDELFGEGTLVAQGKVRRLVYLDRCLKNEFARYEISPNVLVNRLFSVIHHEWKDFMTHLVTLGAINVTDIAVYMEQVIGVFRKVTECSELIQIDIPANASPRQLIEYLEKQRLF